jgi:hypothetical protein
MSHARNQIDRGRFTPYPGTGTPFSAEEVRQLLLAPVIVVGACDDDGVSLGVGIFFHSGGDGGVERIAHVLDDTQAGPMLFFKFGNTRAEVELFMTRDMIPGSALTVIFALINADTVLDTWHANISM